MKTIIIILLLLTALASLPVTNAQDLGSNTPNWKEWTRQNKTQRNYLAQQIALLNTYGEFLKNGYSICKNGMNTIGNIQNADLKQHRVYFNSLKEVNSAISRSPQVKQILQWEKESTKEMKSFLSDAAQEPAFTSEEKHYFEQVAIHVRTASDDALDQLDRLISSGETSMQDDERILRIAAVHRHSSSRFSFVRTFRDQAMTLAAQRRKEKQDIDYSSILHQRL
jgi:hypothetical protein